MIQTAICIGGPYEGRECFVPKSLSLELVESHHVRCGSYYDRRVYQCRRWTIDGRFVREYLVYDDLSDIDANERILQLVLGPGY